jgi:Tfp pilus assembly protein PilF
MFYLTLPAVRLRRICSLLCLLWLAALCAGEVRAQMGGIDPDPGDPGTGGQNVIQGRIYFPSGRMVDKRVKVILTSISGANFSTLSDDSGAFSFRRLAGGSYVVRVDAGQEFLPVTETVDIIQPSRRGGGGSTYTVQINLQLKTTVGAAPPAVLDAGLAGVPRNARAHYEDALKSARSGDSKKAIELFKKAIELHPPYALAYNEMGVQYIRLGDLDNASGALQEAIKLSPDSFGPRLNYGIVLFYKKKYADAGEQLDRSLKINEASGVAHLFRGRVFIKANDFERAEKELLRAVNLGGDVNEAHRFLGGIYNERGDYGRAIQELEAYLKASPNVKDAEQIRQIVRELRAKTAGQR